MDKAGDTPKKIVCDNPKCCLCGLILSIENRVKVFGKSLFDIAGLINSLLGIDVSLYSSSNLFVGTNKCYKRLTKFERIKKSLESLQNEIEEDFKKASESVFSSRTKRMFKDSVPNVNKDSATRQDHTARRIAAKPLKFSDSTPQIYPAETADVSCDFVVAQPRNFLPVSNFSLPPPKDLSMSTKTSTPNSKAVNTSVSVCIKNPSKTVNKTVQLDYESITKALVFGSPQRIAKAVIKCKLLKKSVIESVLSLVSSEVNGLCSRSNPSILRKCDRENIANFNLQSLLQEWKARAPVFYSFLLTCSNCKLMKTCSFLPSVALAGSVLLKQRNSQMNAMASAIGVLIKTASVEVNIICYMYHSFIHFFLSNVLPVVL